MFQLPFLPPVDRPHSFRAAVGIFVLAAAFWLPLNPVFSAKRELESFRVEQARLATETNHWVQDYRAVHEGRVSGEAAERATERMRAHEVRSAESDARLRVLVARMDAFWLLLLGGMLLIPVGVRLTFSGMSEWVWRDAVESAPA